MAAMENRVGCEVVDAAQMSSLLSYSLLTAHLRQAFTHAEAIAAPPRHHHTIPSPYTSSSSSSSPTLLLMPAWPLNPSSSSSYMGVKLVSVFPHNSSVGMSSVSASYLLSSALTGLPLAFLDGKELTLWRTACVSALASQYLACPDAGVLLMVGAGALAPYLIKAHCVAHPSIQTVIIWNRTHTKAESLVRALQSERNASGCQEGLAGKTVYASTDLEKVARMADIICCATLSEKPLIEGSWLRPGTHLDLVGSFTPGMKECDEDAIKKAIVFVDTTAALQEAGELVGHVAIAQGTLSELARGDKQGRLNVHDITVFKSVGCALVDLATAQLVYERLQLTRWCIGFTNCLFMLWLYRLHLQHHSLKNPVNKSALSGLVLFPQASSASQVVDVANMEQLSINAYLSAQSRSGFEEF